MVFREYNFGAIVSVVMLRRGISKATLQVQSGCSAEGLGACRWWKSAPTCNGIVHWLH